MNHPGAAGNAFSLKRSDPNAARPEPVMSSPRGVNSPLHAVSSRIAVSVRSPPGSPPVTGTTATSFTPASA
jgi:hypothetical protein